MDDATLEAALAAAWTECDFLYCEHAARWCLRHGGYLHLACNDDLQELMFGFVGLPVFVEMLRPAADPRSRRAV